MMRVPVRCIVSGTVSAPAIVLDEPVSFWGGFDAHSGRIIDQQHPQCGLSLTGAVVFMRSGRGSSSASSVLAEAVRLGTAPAAFVLQETDEILTLGALVAEEVYGTVTPIVIAGDLTDIEPGETVTIDGDTLTL